MKKALIITVIILVAGALFAWLGLPAGLKAMGLHPAYEGEKATFPGGRALIITTSHDRLGDKGSKKTGVFGSEMTAPYYVFKDGGMQVDLASIKGGPIPIDPMSFEWFLKTEYDDRYLMDAEFQQKVSRSMRIDDVNVSAYDIIYMAGGWGAAYDLGTSAALGGKISEAHKAGKVIGGVCHGPLGLLQAKDQNGESLVKGRRLTAVTDKQVQELGITMTPQHPERELRAAGALFESETAFRDLFADHIVVDGRMVTGQNQNAGVAVAHKMMIIAKGGQ
ncbi:MAG: type 1 glutamine amidotransferase domain-containing protein [Desulfobacteraceae bacterium]|jgi:putative intracellular protease/amidase|nr:MAG: type 1 glutamine amidotransferase domain-containing protein [Desulfobacteraceae bacterium]